MVFTPATKTKKPSLGRIPKDAPRETQQFLKSVKEVLEVGEGKRGDSMDSYLTLRHLTDAGLVESLSNGSLVASSTIPTFSDISQFPGYTTKVPEAPTNVTVTGGFSYIFVKWDVPTDPDNIIVSAEVWRSETDALGTATLRGTSPSSFYVDEVGTGSVTYYYWVRFVSKWSTDDVPIYGPYNAVAGSPGATVLDPAYVLEVLTDRIGSSQLNQSLKTLTDKIEPNEVAIINETATRSLETGELYGSWTLKTAYEQSNGVTYVSGFGTSLEVINGDPVSNFIIKADNFAVGAPGADDFYLTAGVVNGVQTVAIGSAHIKDLAVTNAAIKTVAANKIFAQSGTLAEAFIETGQITNAMIGETIQSNNYVPNSSGWMINKSGFAEFQNAKVTGNITADSINVNSTAIISTLMLQDQAVTFPVSYWNPSYTNIDFVNTDIGSSLSASQTDGYNYKWESGWKNAFSIAFSSTGAPKHVTGSFRFSITNGGVTADTDGNIVMRFYYRILKNGSEYLASVYLTEGYSFDSSSGDIFLDYPVTDKHFSLYDPSPSTGTTEYTVQVAISFFGNQLVGDYLFLSNEYIRVNFWEKSIFSIETKK